MELYYINISICVKLNIFFYNKYLIFLKISKAEFKPYIRSIVKPNLKSKISTNSLLYSYIKRSSLKRIERLKRMFSSLDEFSARFHRQFVWLSLTNVRMSKHLEISRDEGWWKRERERHLAYIVSLKRGISSCI